MDLFLKQKDYSSFFKEANDKNLPNLIKLFSTILGTHYNPTGPEEKVDKVYKVLLSGNWTDSQNLYNVWKKMSQDGNGKWGCIQVVPNFSDCPDYFIIINKPYHFEISKIDFSRSIVIHMEPNFNKNEHIWGNFWANPDKKNFLQVLDHNTSYNNLEWHLSKTYSQLTEEKINKGGNCLSTVLSAKYEDPGQKLRIDFVKYLEKNTDLEVHVFGNNAFDYKNYKGSPPPNCKDEAIFPYKYTFNAENNKQDNYFTEKIVDAILGECLCFYWGTDTISQYINPQAFVKLELKDFEADAKLVKKAIEEDWWSERIDIIRQEKRKILDNLQFFPRFEKIIKNLNTPDNIKV